MDPKVYVSLQPHFFVEMVFARQLTTLYSVREKDSFDIAEWGILVDDEVETKKIMDQVWNTMYTESYTGKDCDLPYVVENMLEVPETTTLETLASIGACYGVENITLSTLMSLLSEFVPLHGEVMVNETQSPSSTSSPPLTAGSPSSASSPPPTAGSPVEANGDEDGDQANASDDSAASPENRHIMPVLLTAAALFLSFVGV